MIRKINFFIHPLNFCPKCKTESLEIYDYFNTPQGYKKIADLYSANKAIDRAFLNRKEFYTIRCKRCGQAYPIRWEYGFPMADATKWNTIAFMSAFKTGGIDNDD